MNHPSFLSIQNISKTFSYKTIFQELSFQLSSGDSAILLGNNGSGKSTLLHVIAGSLSQNSGSILIQDEDTKVNPEIRRKSIGVLFHENHLYEDLSPVENLVFYGSLRKLTKLSNKINRAIEQVNLERFKNIPIKTFSSGMLKRVCIAKLLIHPPKILLLDEPYTGLDTYSIQFLNQFLLEFSKNGGIILMTTHQIESSFSIMNQVLILHNKKLHLLEKSTYSNLEQLKNEYHKLTCVN